MEWDGLRILALFLAVLLTSSVNAPVGAQVKLEHQFPDGKKLTYRVKDRIRQVLTLMGMEIESDDDKTQVFSITVGKRRPDGTLPVEHKVESLHDVLSLPGGIKVVYDSNEPNAPIQQQGLAFLIEVLKLSSEVGYTVVLNDKNRVKGIEGTEKVLEKAEKLSMPARDAIKARFEPEKLKREFEQSHQYLPDILARPGEPWERTQLQEAGPGLTISFRKKYEYVGTEKKGDKTLDKITAKVIEVKFAQDPNSKAPLKVLKSELKVDSTDETILFDRAAGCTVSARSRVRLKGEITFSGGGMELPGAIDLTFSSNIELRPPDAK
jgi:hypothetical protein